MTRSFGLDALSAFKALRTTVNRFNHDDLNEDLARECACKAWHLCDHVFNVAGFNSRFKKLKDFQAYVKDSCIELAYLQDICNESKHAVITQYSPSIKEARSHDGDFFREDFCNEDFDTSRLEIELLDGRTVSFNKVIDSAVDYWSKFFKDSGIT